MLANRRDLLLLLAAAVTVGLASCSGEKTNAELQAASELAAPHDRINATVDVVLSGAHLTSDDITLATETVANAAHEMNDAAGVAAVCDSLVALDIPEEFRQRLLGEQHMALVIQGYYAEEGGEAYFGQADGIARSLLAADGVPPEVLRQVAELQMFALDFVPPEEAMVSGGHWIPYDLASRGFACKGGQVEIYDTSVLSGTLGAALSHIAEAYGSDRAIAVTDSLLSQDPCPTLRAVILADRYDVAVNEEPEVALEAARELITAGDRAGLWQVVRSVSLDITQKGLDAEVALELAGTAMKHVETRADSGQTYFAVGLAEKALGDYEKAAKDLKSSILMDAEAPGAPDARVDALLAVYEKWRKDDLAIDFLAYLLAREVEPDEERQERLTALLESQGRSADEIPKLLEQKRYTGVQRAPDFTLIDRDGDEYTLSEREGRVVVLCFWGFG